MPYSHSSGSYGSITTSHFVYHICLLQSQDLLHHNMACIIYLSLSMCVHTANLCCRRVIEYNRRSTWRCPLRELRGVLGGYDHVTLEMYWEAVIEWVWRCTWRPRSSELRDALGGCDRTSLEMHKEPEIE